MKTLLLLLLVAAATQSLFAQTVTLTFPISGVTTYPPTPDRQQNIEVLAGETFEVLFGSAPAIIDGIGFGSQGVVVAGPKTVVLRVPVQNQLVFTYRLTTATPAASQSVASQAVVIPENASAPVDVIFESSTDLINWTAAVAGSYAADPGLAAMKEPSQDAVLRTKIVLEAGFLSEALPQAVAAKIETAAEALLTSCEELATKAIASQTDALAAVCRQGWRVHWKSKRGWHT